MPKPPPLKRVSPPPSKKTISLPPSKLIDAKLPPKKTPPPVDAKLPPKKTIVDFSRKTTSTVVDEKVDDKKKATTLKDLKAKTGEIFSSRVTADKTIDKTVDKTTATDKMIKDKGIFATVVDKIFKSDAAAAPAQASKKAMTTAPMSDASGTDTAAPAKKAAAIPSDAAEDGGGGGSGGGGGGGGADWDDSGGGGGDDLFSQMASEGSISPEEADEAMDAAAEDAAAAQAVESAEAVIGELLSVIGSSKKFRSKAAPRILAETISSPSIVNIARFGDPKSVDYVVTKITVQGGERWIPAWNKANRSYEKPVRVIIYLTDGSSRIFKNVKSVNVYGGIVIASDYESDHIIGLTPLEQKKAAELNDLNRKLTPEEYALVEKWQIEQAEAAQKKEESISYVDPKTKEKRTVSATWETVPRKSPGNLLDPYSAPEKPTTKLASVIKETVTKSKSFLEDITWWQWVGIVAGGVLIGVGIYYESREKGIK